MSAVITTDEMKTMVQEAALFLIGIGEEWETLQGDEEKEKTVREAFEKLAGLTEGKNYFVISSCKNSSALQFGIDPQRYTAPFEKEDQESWERYLKWLSGTLNKRVLLLELGTGFKAPTVIRWPFEKMAALNLKAELIRVGETFYQLPENKTEKMHSVPENSVSWIRKS